MRQDTSVVESGIAPAFLRPEQAAQYLGISKRHLGTLRNAGIVAGCKVSKKLMLYPRRELEAAILKFRRGK